MCELAADEETGRGEVVRVGEGDPPGLGGHRGRVCVCVCVSSMVERCYGESAAVCCPSNATHGTNSGVPCTLRFEIYMHVTLHASTRTMSTRVSAGKMAMAPQESVQP